MKKDFKPLRYQNTIAKDIVRIDVLKSDTIQIMKLFTDSVFEAIDEMTIDVQFHIYKKKPSWINYKIGIQSRLINFTYDIKKLPFEGQFVHCEGYELSFEVKDINNIPHHTYYIPVKNECFPKKRLIRHLLNSIANF